jgi:hypothetical protein
MIPLLSWTTLSTSRFQSKFLEHSNKTTAYNGDHAVVRVKFAHSNQANVRQVRMTIRIAFGERPQVRQMIVAVERRHHKAFMNHIQDRRHALQMERRFGQHGLACEQGFAHMRSQFQCPRMVGIPGAGKRHKEASIRDAFHFREYPFREERSFGRPLMLPASRMNEGISPPERALSNCSRTIWPCDTPIFAAASSSQAANFLSRWMVNV